MTGERRLRFEVVVDGAAGLRAAHAGGADRVEVCAQLAAGGVTPPPGVVGEAIAAAGDLPVHVLVRHRAGDFHYNGAEVAAMVDDVAAARAAGAGGVVIGALTPAGDVDVNACRRMVEAAGPLSVTFHRAFDEVRDPLAALDAIVELGCDRVLTSGQAPTAPQGAEVLRRLVDGAGDRIIVLAGGGIRAHNVARLVADTGVNEVHFSAGTPTDPATVRAVIAAAGAHPQVRTVVSQRARRESNSQPSDP